MTGFVFCNRYGNIMNAQSVNRAIKRISSAYNATEEIEAKKEQREPVLLPDFSAHVCRHTYCSNMAKSGMNPKTLQYLMGHSDISVTMNVYTHIGFDDAEEELKRMEEFRKAQAEVDKKNDAKAVSQKMFKVV